MFSIKIISFYLSNKHRHQSFNNRKITIYKKTIAISPGKKMNKWYKIWNYILYVFQLWCMFTVKLDSDAL